MDKKQSHILEAIIITIGLIGLGWFIKGGIDNFVNKDRVIKVKGLSERYVNADRVTWPIVFKEVGNDLPSLYQKINVTTGAITKFLKNNGIKDDEISVNAPSVFDQTAESYSTIVPQYRYKVTEVIVVTSSQIDKVRELIASQGDLLKDGIAVIDGGYSYPIKYSYTGFNDLKPEMIKEATENARQAAEQFAEDSDSELGKIISANQGQFIIENRDENSPHIKYIRVVSSINYALEN